MFLLWTRCQETVRSHLPRRERSHKYCACACRGSAQDMSIVDKLTGRFKKAAGDLADDPSLRREGAREEHKGEAKEQLAHAQDKVEDKAAEVADLERKT